MKLFNVIAAVAVADKAITDTFDVESPKCVSFPEFTGFTGETISTCAIDTPDGSSCTHACDNLVTSTCVCTEVNELGLVTLKDGGCVWEQDRQCEITSWKQTIEQTLTMNFNPCDDEEAFVALVKEAFTTQTGYDADSIVVILQCETNNGRRRRDTTYTVTAHVTLASSDEAVLTYSDDTTMTPVTDAIKLINGVIDLSDNTVSQTFQDTDVVSEELVTDASEKTVEDLKDENAQLLLKVGELETLLQTTTEELNAEIDNLENKLKKMKRLMLITSSQQQTSLNGVTNSLQNYLPFLFRS